MVSKMVTDRQKSSEAVQASARTHKELAVAGIGAVLGPEAGAAASVLLEQSAARLEGATAAMTAADDAHANELSDDAEPLKARDDASAEVYADLTEFREVGGAVYGDAYMTRLGFEGTTSRDPLALHRLSGFVLDALAHVPPPAPRRKGLTLDVAAWTTTISKSRGTLGEALSKVATERREAELTQVAKNRSIEEYDHVFSVTATLVSAVLSAGGQKELARRVRPSVRHTGRTEEPEEPSNDNPPSPATV